MERVFKAESGTGLASVGLAWYPERVVDVQNFVVERTAALLVGDLESIHCNLARQALLLPMYNLHFQAESHIVLLGSQTRGSASLAKRMRSGPQVPMLGSHQGQWGIDEPIDIYRQELVY